MMAQGTTLASPSRRRQRSSRRVVLLGIGYGVAGLMMTFAIAILSLLYAPMTIVRDDGGVSSNDVLGRETGYVGFHPGQVYAGFGIRESMNYWFWVNGERGFAAAGVSWLTCGWPFYAFVTPPDQFPATTQGPEFDAAVQESYARATSTILPRILRARQHRVLPTQPVFFGMAGNTLIFAMALALLGAGLSAFRRIARRRSNRCIDCGYPITGTGRCPECGAETMTLKAPLEGACP
jgi:hypothetical protein